MSMEFCMDCSLPVSSVHGILQARILNWVPRPFSIRSSRPRDQIHLLHYRQILYHLSHQGSPPNRSCKYFCLKIFCKIRRSSVCLWAGLESESLCRASPWFERKSWSWQITDIQFAFSPGVSIQVGLLGHSRPFSFFSFPGPLEPSRLSPSEVLALSPG